MKTYVITLSQVFPTTHPRKGEPTGFADALRKTKLHTIRANFHLWEKRFKQIERGKACLSIRQWTGKPYASKQRELCVLTKNDGIGVQRLQFIRNVAGQYAPHNLVIDDCGRHIPEVIAENDGLSYQDWFDWFNKYDKSKPLAIIWFCGWRY